MKMIEIEQLNKIVLDALDEIKAFHIQVIDVTGKSNFTDCMIIATGNSSRQVKALAHNILKIAKEQNIEVLGSEGEQQGEWILIDLGICIVHIMQADIRDFYNLEKLWGDDSPLAVSNDTGI